VPTEVTMRKLITAIALGCLIGATLLAGAVYALDYCRVNIPEPAPQMLLHGQAMAYAPALSTQGDQPARGWEAAR
jgi:hypothetical protein